VVSRVVPEGGQSEVETFTSDWFPTNGVRNWRFTPYNGLDYDKRGDFRDARSITFANNDSWIAVSSQSASRPVAIDWNDPVFLEFIPFVLPAAFRSTSLTGRAIRQESPSRLTANASQR
jgi:hypothetical protein